MKLTVGILTYTDEKYLERCLETLFVQEGLGKLGKDWQIIIRDNGAPDKNYILRAQENFPQVLFLMNEDNAGFSKGHNDIMRKFPAEFHAVLNNDVLYNPDFLSKLLCALEEQPRFGSSTGKLLYWDYGKHPEKTNIIDSCGLEMTKAHAFVDRGQGKVDTAFTPNNFDTPGICFGGSGAAVMYRREALEKVAIQNRSGRKPVLSTDERRSSATEQNNRSADSRVRTAQQTNTSLEFFDERMFMYKEDVDLAYRLMVQGYFCLFVPDAVGWHNRTTSVPRRKRSLREKIGSAAHESLILQKHKAQWSFSTRFRTMFRQYCKWSYLFFFEPHVFFGARKLLKEIST